MTFPFWCVLVCAALPYVLAGAGGYYRTQQFETMDNNHPRTQSAKLEGAGARAYAAQQNAWENAIVFTATVMIISMSDLDSSYSQILCILYVTLRIIHPVVYLKNLSAARSIVNTSGLICCAALIVMAASLP